MPVFDTSAIIDLTRARPTPFRASLETIIQRCVLAGEPLYTTRFNLAEMYTGLELSIHPERDRAALDKILDVFSVLEFDDHAALIFGSIDAKLQRAGRPVDDMDMLIAAVTRGHGQTLVTRNPRHFAGIPELSILSY